MHSLKPFKLILQYIWIFLKHLIMSTNSDGRIKCPGYTNCISYAAFQMIYLLCDYSGKRYITDRIG